MLLATVAAETLQVDVETSVLEDVVEPSPSVTVKMSIPLTSGISHTHCRSCSTMLRTRSSNDVVDDQPSSRRARLASPINW